MTNYTKNVDYAAKDALASADANKIIYGTELDAEFAEIQIAIATKYQSSDIATQAQAEAGASNAVLMTPLRVSQYLAGAGGGSGAGIVGDLLGLADPNADRIVFWDDSAGAGAFLAASTGLAISGTNLTVNTAEVDHNTLLNYDANRHFDHTAISITAGSGLTGGGTIASTRTLALDILGLTTDNVVDTTVDYLPYYDAGEGANNKVLMSTIVGVSLGDGNWYRSTSQSVPANTDTPIVYDTAVYDSLVRGTYSTSTGIYTAGASGARIQITAVMAAASLGAGQEETVIVHQNTSATERARSKMRSQGGTISNPTVVVTVVVSLTAAETCFVSAYISNASTLSASSATAAYNTLSIVELA